ncbi:hypothetical protein Dsin_018241 [Dipteronia sinensis]|uniref:GPN-loop GTPase n=1 Tax=Dipteronia sinensis TaxID=43782 RepID=A0AAE0A4Y3_9ROSI|nr:hypothetical protein Dsin_018241 [Dipteronia sinensis]
MKQFNLGPNGGILTSLNLLMRYKVLFGKVVSLIAKRADQLDYVLVDTPGAIIITEAFASTFPTIVTYVVYTPRSASPTTFMGNMLYACSILYKTRVPLVLAFNKIDVSQREFALESHNAFTVAGQSEKDFANFRGSLNDERLESYLSRFGNSEGSFR